MPIQTEPFTLFESFEKHPKTGETRKRALRYDLNALADFEQEVGMGFAQLMQMKAAFATVRAITWCGVKWQDRTLTVEKAGDLIGEYVREGGDINEILTKCIETAVNQGALGRPRTPEADETMSHALPADSDGGTSGTPPTTTS
jgi:hypothetical protein